MSNNRDLKKRIVKPEPGSDNGKRYYRRGKKKTQYNHYNSNRRNTTTTTYTTKKFVGKTDHLNGVIYDVNIFN